MIDGDNHNNESKPTFDKGFGVFTFEGKEYALLRDAMLTNRVFPGWYGDANDGEEYVTEFDAPAIDSEGNSCRVVWRFNVVKGDEPIDDGDHDWDDVADVEW